MAMLVVFRADASTALGAGHLVRCAALAHALRKLDVASVFLCREDGGHLHEWLGRQGLEVRTLRAGPRAEGAPAWQIDAEEDATETLRAIVALGRRPDWLVIDHYGIDARWQALVRPAVARMLVIDDLGQAPPLATALLDVGLDRERVRPLADLAPGCKLLLGPRYALLRPEFKHQAQEVKPEATRPRLLACMGGSDPCDALGTVLVAWQRLPVPRPWLDIAVGSHSPNLPALRERCAGLDRVTLHVQGDDMPRLMARATWLLGSAGGISWERCCMGLPAVMGTVADNQRANLQGLARARTGVAVGAWQHVGVERLAALLQRLLARPGLRGRMAARARRLVDGAGAERVALHMAAAGVHLRPARADDAVLAYAWRNAEETRRHSFDPRLLTLQEHLDWWARTLADPTRALLIAQVGSRAVGVLRLDRDSESDLALVSIYLDPQTVGLGLGPHVLAAGQRWAVSNLAVAGLRAGISQDNRASMVAFEAAGFVRSFTAGQWLWTA